MEIKLGNFCQACLVEQDTHLAEKDTVSGAPSEHLQDTQIQARAFLETLLNLDVLAELSLDL